MLFGNPEGYLRTIAENGREAFPSKGKVGFAAQNSDEVKKQGHLPLKNRQSVFSNRLCPPATNEENQRNGETYEYI